MNTEPMTINVYLDNLNEEEREKFLALAEKANKPKVKAWKPEENENFYMITYDGNVHYNIWLNFNCQRKQYEIGNCFKTKEEAQFTVEWLKVFVELKRFAEEHNESDLNWNDTVQDKYYIFMDEKNNVNVGCGAFIRCSLTYFSSREIAEQAIKTIGEERLKKYYFEIKEEQK